MSSTSAPKDAPPPYQGGADSGHNPQDPPPKYEPPKGPQGYPQPAYPPQGYQSGGVVYSQPQPVTVIQMSYGPSPVTINCPHCQNHVTTSLVYETGALTWIVSGVLCLFGCWLGCCLIPFCIPELQDVEHRCPNCYRVVGMFRRLS
ncbi:cell death-inducing p53-target protein 1 homolog isoform X2 [Liolophura sinensis]|uniref:cell death-inducing p53-target protein 1 homolog isoform X2 n=1 Tax=Liolophura sinensis TaxID=3198878 RepID=UPI0031594FEE